MVEVDEEGTVDQKGKMTGVSNSGRGRRASKAVHVTTAKLASGIESHRHDVTVDLGVDSAAAWSLRSGSGKTLVWMTMAPLHFRGFPL